MSRDFGLGGMQMAAPVPLGDSDPAQQEVERRYRAVLENANKLMIGGQLRNADVSDLEFVSEIGHGSCGHVSKYKYIHTGTLFAVKEMAKTNNTEEMKRVLMDLDVVMRASDCPNIVHAYGYFITNEKVMVCMEVMSTCLDRLLAHTNHQPVPEDIIGQIALSVLIALDYLKETHHIIHRDVKPSNILINWQGLIKLCDFGISGKLIQSRVYTRQAGCPPYMAPERLDPKAPAEYDIRSDVWSIGMTMVELAKGNYPYHHFKQEFEVFSAILSGPPPLLKQDDGFSPEFVEFVALCLQKDPTARPRYPELLNHPFILKAKAAKEQYPERVQEWVTDQLTMEDD